jgi:hypothetical protein
MDKGQLNELLKQLHAELGRTDSVDAESRDTLRKLAKDIQDLLDRAEGDETPGYQSLLDQLRSTIVQFEVSHPRLSLAIAQVINALADMGI